MTLSVSTQLAQCDDLKLFEVMLKSVSFADEIIVFNMERTDKEALALFAKYKARVIEVKPPIIVEEIRTREVLEAKNNWVLVMDFDELIPPALKEEILTVIKDKPAAYTIKRRNFSLGFPLRYGGWGDDYVARVFHKSIFVDWPTNIHSTPKIRGEYNKLDNFMEHHKDANLTQMVEKTNRYSEIEAKLFFEGNLPPVTCFTLIRKSTMEFIRRYFLKLGVLDGTIGLIQSLYQSYSIFVTYAKLYELQNKKQK
ncbi:MAG: hypothetical protein ABII80_02960 [bacterium]